MPLNNQFYTFTQEELETIGKRLKDKMKETGLSQNRLHEISGVSRPLINSMINGYYENNGGTERRYHNPKPGTLLKLCNALGCDMEYFTGEIEHSTHDLQFICEYTGLSESAVSYLHFSSIKDKEFSLKLPDELSFLVDEFVENSFVNIVSRIIENKTLVNLITKYQRLLEDAGLVLESHFDELEDFEYSRALGEDYLQNYETEEEFDAAVAEKVDIISLNHIRNDRNIYKDSIRHGLKLLMAEEIVKIIDLLVTHNLREQNIEMMIKNAKANSQQKQSE
mgnify:CR=1 FL=1